MSANELLTKISRFQLVLGAVAALFGALGFFLARDIDFQAAVGVETGYPAYEIHLMTFNRLGALLVLAVGVVGLVAGILRKPAIGYLAAGASALLALQVLVQWRDKQANALGTAGQNLSFDLLLAIGFGVTALLAHHAPALRGTSEPAGAEPLSR